MTLVDRETFCSGPLPPSGDTSKVSPAVIVNEVIAEDDVGRQRYLLLWAVVTDLIALEDHVPCLIHTVAAPAIGGDGRERIPDVVMNPAVANDGLIAHLDTEMSSRDFRVLDDPAVGHKGEGMNATLGHVLDHDVPNRDVVDILVVSAECRLRRI